MHEVFFVIVGIAVGVVWAASWTALLHVLGVAPVIGKVEDLASTRERLKRVGKLKSILIFGVLGPGLMFGLAMITIDLVSHRSAGWLSELVKLAFYALFFGVFQGSWRWHRVFRDPVPFPPDYPPSKL